MHLPVLFQETITALNPQLGEFFIDGTFGNGGHARGILEKIGPQGKLLAIDWNEQAIIEAKKKYQHDNRVMVVEANFSQIPEIIEEYHLPKANGLLLDLGVSSDELERSGRGFSFQKDEPLLMTYSDDKVPVRQLLKELTKAQLTDIIKRYGEENWASAIANAIKDQERKKLITTSQELADLIIRTVPKSYEHGRIHPATRTFQALRIYANQELENLEHLLNSLSTIMAPASRVVIISFHSLEDRIVKQKFKLLQKEAVIEIINKKPIIAGHEEIINNPRARSAKLRAAIVNI